MPNDTANFNEILEISVDAAAFKAGLDQIAQIYQTFKESLGADAGNVLQVGSFNAIIDALKGIKDTVIETTSEEIQSFQELGKEVSGVLEQITAATAEMSEAREAALVKARSAPKEQLDNEPTIFSAKQNKLGDDIEMEQQGIADQYVTLWETLLGKREAGEEKLAARQKKLAEDIAIEQQGLEDRFTEQRIKNEEKIAAKKLRESEEGGLGGFVGEIANVAKFLVLWQAVGAVINGITSVLSSPFVALKSGVEYLEQTEKAADDLSGVIQANVKFSDDFATNLRKSREGAEEVVKAFQNIAIKDNVKVDDLDRVFKAFSEAGGAGVVGSLNEMVKVTELFTLALKASGGSAQSVRSVVSDIPKLLNGTLAPTSKLLEVLGMTSAEAKTMVEQAKLQGDLLAQLEPKLTPYLTATQLASLHHAELVEKIDLLKSRWEGLAAGPIFSTINGYLTEAADWLDKNKELTDQWARVLGKVANDSLTGIMALLKQFPSLLGGVVNQVGLMAINFAEAANSMTLIAALVKVAGMDGDAFDKGKALTAALDNHHNTQANLSRHKQELAAKTAPGYTPPTSSDGGSVLDDDIGNAKTNPSLDKGKKVKSNLRDDKEDFQDEVTAIKAAYEAIKDAAEESLKARTMSHKEAAVQIGAALEDERKSYEAAAQAYRKTVTNDATIPKDEKGRLIKASLREETSFSTNTDKQLSGLQQSANSEDAQIRQAGVKAALALEQEKQKGLLEIYKQEQQDGMLSDRAVLDAEIAESARSYAAKLSSVEKELAAVAKGTVEYAALISQQDLLLQQSSNAHDVSTLKSISLDEQIAARRRQNALALLQIASEQSIVELQTNEVFKDSGRVLEEVFFIRQREIDAKRQEIQVELQLAQAKLAGGDAAKAASIKLAENTTETLKNVAAQVAAIRGATGDSKLTQSINLNQLRRDTVPQAQMDVRNAQQNLNAARSSGSDIDDKEFKAKLQALEDALQAATDKLDGIETQLAPVDIGDALSKVQKDLLGVDLGAVLSSTASIFEKFGSIVEASGNIFKDITAATQAYSQGQKQGGTIGGIGALLQSGPVSQLAQLGGPIVAGIVQGIGSALSFVGALFTAKAEHIAGQIKQSFDTTVKALQQGSATISQTLDAVTNERSQAISQLSGVKGGKEQLAKLLPSLDDEIANLKTQQMNILRSFDEALGALVLKTGTANDALSSTFTSWVAINKQVQDYVNAGGDAAKAAQFLSLSLADIQQKNQEELNQGQQQAIQDAMHLNDLLLQKVNLERQYAQQIFALQNSDSIERSNNGIISRAQQLQQAQINNQQQLFNLNNEISLTGQKLTAEKTIFDISSDINELHREDNLLALASLDLQLAKYASIKDILASITKDSNGLNSLNTNLFGSQGVTVGAINVNIQTPNGSIITSATGAGVAQSVYAELQLLARQGTTTT